MRLGALIVTTGLKEDAGVASLLKSTGTVSAGQRMISVFQCCGIGCVGLVTEKETQKERRQFAQEGVLFFGADSPNVSSMEGAKLGLSYMADKFDRIFLVTGNLSLFLPETLRVLLEQDADLVIPTYSHMNGYPVLMSSGAARELLQRENTDSLEQTILSMPVSREFVPVEDPGVIVQGDNDKNREELIQRQAKQLLRPATDVRIQIGNLFFDGKLAGLLRLIDETHSVRRASELMQMSYSTAWGMLNDADETWEDPLILRKRGGPGGSGCELSLKGHKLLRAYDQYCTAMNHHADRLYQEMFSNILE